MCIAEVAYATQSFNIVFIMCEITLTAECPCRASGFPSEGATIQIPVPIHACILHQAEGLLKGRPPQLSLSADPPGLLLCFADPLLPARADICLSHACISHLYSYAECGCGALHHQLQWLHLQGVPWALAGVQNCHCSHAVLTLLLLFM